LNARTNLTYHHVAFSAADVQQLEDRRVELEQQRFQLLEELREHKGKLRDLRAQRDTVERQRAALLSARSIEHVQRELADVQRKLEQAAAGATHGLDQIVAADNPYRASDFLAQLTNGDLVRLELIHNGRRARVVARNGEVRPVELLTATERDQVYLSLCLALHAAAAQHGVWLPLVLDDPFVRLDGNGVASLVAVLDGFARQGHQVIVFTGQQAAAERLLSLGVGVQDIASLRVSAHEHAIETPTIEPPIIETIAPRKRQGSPARSHAAAQSDHSDAA
jgi:DNA repair exonuclease SbcCD ATPase subunit